MSPTPSSSQPSSKTPSRERSARQRPASSGAEYGEAGDPHSPDEASDSLQARAGQGQVSGRSLRAAGHAPTATVPPVDIYEDETGVTLLADLPGASSDRLELRVEGDTLLIEASAAVPDLGEVDLVHGELLSPLYRRSFTLSRDLDAQRIEARLADGVLRLRLHKLEQAKPRRIEVQPG